MFFDYTELTRQETRRMRLLGIPLFVVALLGCLVMQAPWSFVVAVVALLPYSFLYSKAFIAVAERNASPPGWLFYACVVLAQAAFIALLFLFVRN